MFTLFQFMRNEYVRESELFRYGKGGLPQNLLDTYFSDTFINLLPNYRMFLAFSVQMVALQLQFHVTFLLMLVYQIVSVAGALYAVAQIGDVEKRIHEGFSAIIFDFYQRLKNAQSHRDTVLQVFKYQDLQDAFNCFTDTYMKDKPSPLSRQFDLLANLFLRIVSDSYFGQRYHASQTDYFGLAFEQMCTFVDSIAQRSDRIDERETTDFCLALLNKLFEPWECLLPAGDSHNQRGNNETAIVRKVSEQLTFSEGFKRHYETIIFAVLTMAIGVYKLDPERQLKVLSWFANKVSNMADRAAAVSQREIVSPDTVQTLYTLCVSIPWALISKTLDPPSARRSSQDDVWSMDVAATVNLIKYLWNLPEKSFQSDYKGFLVWIRIFKCLQVFSVYEGIRYLPQESLLALTKIDSGG
jgi:cell division protein FtsL